MTQIRTFVAHTVVDLRGGRNTWRVLGFLWSTALVAGVLTNFVK